MNYSGIQHLARRAWLAVALTASALLGFTHSTRANQIAYFRTIYGADFTSVGVGAMRDTGVGTITLAGVTGAVTRAYLYWAGPMNNLNPTANAVVTVNTQTVVGVNIGFSQDNCWGFLVGQAYRADVTDLVKARRNGAYTLRGFTKPGGVNVNGASLLVFFDDGRTNNNRDVVLFDGNDANATSPHDTDGWNVTLPGIMYRSGTVRMSLHVSDGQSYLDEALIVNNATIYPKGAVFSGNTVPGVNNGPGGLGRLWDIRTFAVNSFMTPGTNTLVMTHAYTLGNDCVDLVVAAVDLPAGAAPVQPNQLPTVTCPNLITVTNPEPIVVQAQAGDADGDPLSYQISVDGAVVQTGFLPAGGPPTAGTINLTNNFSLGMHVVTFSVSDGKASASAGTAVNVIDIAPPTLTCSSNLVVSTDAGKSNVFVRYTVTVADNFPKPSLDCQPPSGNVFQKGVTTVNCTAVDGAGNRATCSFTVTVVDTEPPAIACSSNIVKNLDAGKSNAVVAYTAPVATDNCPGVRVACAPPSGATFATGVTTVRCTATDKAGNTADCTFTVTIGDAQPPVLRCPTVPPVFVEKPETNATVTFTVTVTDNLPGVTYACTPPSGSVFPLGTNVVNCIATDVAGNTDRCSFQVVVTQLPDPCPRCATNPPPVIAPCPGAIDFRDYLATNFPGFAVTCTPPPGSVFPQGTNRVSCNFTNARGQLTNFAFTITIADTNAPTLRCPADITVAADPGKTNAAVNFNVEAADDCSRVTLSYSKAPGSVFPLGATPVTVVARDDAGNTARCTFTVTVLDNRLHLPVTNLVRNTDPGLCSAIVTYPFRIVPGQTIVCEPPSGSSFAKGVTTVHCTASNAAGRSTNASFTVTVLDKELPTLVTPTNILLNCATAKKTTTTTTKDKDTTKDKHTTTTTTKDKHTTTTTAKDKAKDADPDSNRVTWNATATDNCPGVSVVCVPPSGTVFSNGVTTVRCTATDASSNSVTASFQVRMTDTEPPVITKLKASKDYLWPANHKMVAVKIDAKAEDNCSKKIALKIIAVNSSEPVLGGGPGDLSPDWVITGALTVNLRAERSGSTPRIYTITVEAKDETGNASTRSIPVKVEHKRSTTDGKTTDKETTTDML